MDWDELWSTFIENCRQIFALAYSTEETEQQKKLKEGFKKLSVRLLNFFFLVIILMGLYLGFDWLFTKYNWLWPNLKSGFLKSAVAFIGVLLLLLVVISFLIRFLLWLFKWISITDIFKLYIFFELVVLFLNFSKADRIQKGPIALQMVDKVFHTNFFSHPVDTVKETTKTILIKPKVIIRNK
jgi:hypothetical protein